MVRALAVVVLAMVAACADTGSESRVGSGSQPGIGSTELPVTTVRVTAPPTTIVPTTAAPTTSDATAVVSGPDVVAPDDVIVSVSGGEAGLGAPAEVAGLSVIAAPVVGAPWLRFDLVLTSCCGERNPVVFEPGPGGEFTVGVGDPAVLEVVGPTCEAPVTCEGTTRSVPIGGPGVVAVSFEVRPLVPVEELRGRGPLRGSVPVLFGYTHPNLDDQAMPIGLRIDVLDPGPALAGVTTPRATPDAAVSVVGGGFELLQFPIAAVADTPTQLAEVLAASTLPVDVDGLGIDWSSHAAIVLTIPTNGCPPLLAGLDVQAGAARPVFVSAGYYGCIDPLWSHTVIAAVDRHALADVDELVLPAEASYFDQDVRARVEISAPGPARAAPAPAVAVDGSVRGTVALPAVGEATVTTLDDGTPVFVIRHHDGSLSALDSRAAVDSLDAADRLQLLSWTAHTRIFLGSGAWDEYGRRLDGFRTTDLTGFATRVTGSTVEIGAPVTPPTGAPITATADPPAMASHSIPLTDPVALHEALAVPVGTTTTIDATVIVDPSGAHLCDVDTNTYPIPSCPPGSPIADAIEPELASRTAWFGPLIATRTHSGFTRIAPTGGYAGQAL